MKKILAPILVLLLALILAACAIAQAQPTTQPFFATIPADTRTTTLEIAPTDTSLPTFTIPQIPTQTPISTSTRPPSPTVTSLLSSGPNGPITLISIKMYDNLGGWGVDSQGRILKTTDGGFTWVDTAPGKYIFPYARNFTSVDLFHAWFLDTEPLTTSVCSPVEICERWTVWRTVNGGISWSPARNQTGSSDIEPMPQSIHFANLLFGWSLVWIHTGPMGGGYYQVFTSADGGVSWQTSTMTYSEIDEPCIYSGERLWFSDEQNGWRGNTCKPYEISASGQPYFIRSNETTVDDFIKRHFLLIDHSSDGGNTWASQVIAAPNDLLDDIIRRKNTGFQGFVDHNVSRIRSYGPHAFGFLATFAFSEKTMQDYNNAAYPDKMYSYFYISFNNGQSYKILPVSNDVASNGGVYFASSSLGWKWGGVNNLLAIEKTTDGGLTWETTEENLPWVGNLQFVNEKNGWAITNYDKLVADSTAWQWLPNSGVGSSHPDTDLFYTSDGGKTWNKIEPMLLSR